jgi:hypothetical protein
MPPMGVKMTGAEWTDIYRNCRRGETSIPGCDDEVNESDVQLSTLKKWAGDSPRYIPYVLCGYLRGEKEKREDGMLRHTITRSS